MKTTFSSLCVMNGQALFLFLSFQNVSKIVVSLQVGKCYDKIPLQDFSLSMHHRLREDSSFS